MNIAVTMKKGKNDRIVVFFLCFLITLSRQNQQLTTIQIQKPVTQSNEEITWDNIFGSEAYEHLNKEIESLDDEYITHFLGYYHIQQSRLLQALNDESMAPNLKIKNIKQNPGNYLVLLGKMYFYNILPKSQLTGFTWSMYKTESRYLLAYFYLKIAAEKYENAQAYYYLAVLDYYKITPHETLIKNLEKEIQQISQKQGYEKVYELHQNQLLDYLKNQRFVSVQHNLFMASMIGHHGASLALGHMFKEGIGLDKNYKNCTTALSYYLSVVKETYVDYYEFRSAYSDEKNFEKQLYAKRKIVFENQQNVDVVSDSEFFDSQTIKAMYELADNYFIGKNGFRKSYVKAAQLFAKLAAQDHKNSMSMLGMCYFKGQGVPLDRKRARVLFEHSSKVSISEAMLIVMDYLEIESKGHRQSAIIKMKEIYDKKKDNMNTILKYLFANLIIKGDVPSLKVDDAILLMGTAAKEGHLMAKISMGLLFADGIDVNYDCARAINYFSQEAISHPFFMDKFYIARFGLKQELFTFSLIKYLELSIVGDTNSFINALYILEIENEKSLDMNLNSWSLKKGSQNSLYQMLKQEKIIPDIYTFFQKEYSFMNKKLMKFNRLQKLLQGDSEVLKQHLNYIKKKIIKVCAVTKENSLMNFYEYKMNEKEDVTLLNTISNGSPDKLHVLESRYLLGQYYHKRYFQSKQEGRQYTKDQYKALQEYKRAASSPILGRILFYLEEIKLNPDGINFEEDGLFDFSFVNDFLSFTFVLSVLVFVLYYKRSKKLDEIHRKQLEKRQQQIKVKEQEDFNRRIGNSFSERQNDQIKSNYQEKILSPNLENSMQKDDKNQPEISQQRLSSGYRIGSSLEEDDHLVLREYEQYKFEQNPTKIEETEIQNFEKEVKSQETKQKEE